MKRRVLSLIIFRFILNCTALLYQLLAKMVEFRAFPFTAFVGLSTFVSVAGWIYLLVLRRIPNDVSTIQRFVTIQFVLDALAISALVWFTGGLDSSLGLFYLSIIPISAAFFSKAAIYAFTIFCFSLYYLVSIHLHPWMPFHQNGPYTLSMPSNVASTLAVQFVLFLSIALASAFLQGAYRTARSALRSRELRIRALQEMRNRIVESLHSGLVLCDTHGHILYDNRMAQKLLCQPKLTGKNIWSALGIPAPPSINDPNRKWPERIERWIDFPNRRRLFGISYSPLMLSPGHPGFLMIMQDLTEFRLLEEKQRFEDKMAAVGKMAAGVAHEIRNPLASIKASIQVLHEFVPQDPAAHELFYIVDKESNRLNQIITHFLEFTRPTAPSQMAPVDLVTLLQRFIRLAGQDKDLAAMNLEATLPDQPMVVFGDESRLMQVFWNVIRNAVQASQAGSKIQVTISSQNESAAIVVQDQGIGMTQEQLDDLFTPFQSFRPEGSGLGMAITYDIIQNHHGKIQVESELGQGTTMTICLPLHGP